MVLRIFNLLKVFFYILREIFVNYVGYKLGLRDLLKRSKHNNITCNIKLDLQDKGFKHNKIVQNFILTYKVKKITMLEMGPGGTLIHGLMSINSGWQKYIAVDAFPSNVWNGYPLKIYDLFFTSLERKKRDKLKKDLKSSINKSGPIFYYGINGLFNKDLNKKFSNESIDFIYSWGVLEHIESPIEVFEKNFQMLTKKGSILHIIDTHPHTWNRFENPYIFLTIPNFIWSLMYKGRGFINRYRYKNYVSWAKQAGFKVKILKKEVSNHKIDKIRPYMRNEYINLSNSEILTERIYMFLTK